MHGVGAKATLMFLGAAFVVGLAALVWSLGASSSEAQQGAMQNCPLASKWGISVWSGDDGTEAGEALATCGDGAVSAAYYIDPETQGWLRWFAGRPAVSNLQTLNDMQGIMALGATGAPAPTATPTPIASPTVTPEATPPPAAGGFTVSNTSDYENLLGDLWVVGEVKNNNSFDAEFVKVEATFFDASDNVVASDYGYSCLDIIPAGGDSPFDILVFSPPTNIARYTLQAYDDPADEAPPSGLSISGVSTRTDQLGYYHVTGLVKNNSSDTYEFVILCVALYDSAGKVIRVDFTFIGPDTLAPGQSASFDSFASVDSTPVASHRVWVDGDRQ